ncbi:GNAT family N-acetyltransferase [Pseudomonas deceptionensis]|uniref:Acetyltransferase (GNAT) domain-containing protein n=1 Tax=Pseudomonas deceptionensis TaxID=882211 RepID=A0A0J6GCD9_PSEDM|nr:GNAT family N-acetyltransferase [Pseudomonas deceptionensis]KMM79320.1 acetyltransferase [Pseudomonas deceptionensis]SEF02487.1 Acetyltransferase (GNAT) domain-containing protein [Pseudomonas deceptionensis]
MQCQIRRALAHDAQAISKVVIAALRESNARDYSPEVIAQVEQHFCPAAILTLMKQRQMYVAVVEQHVVGTASLDQAVVRSVFVSPRHQGRGIGQRLMARLKEVATAAQVEELRVPSSLTAESFYAQLGFQKVRDEFHGAERTVIMALRLDA